MKSQADRMPTPRLVEMYTLLRMALAQLAKFRQELHALRHALSTRRERAIREQGPGNGGPGNHHHQAPVVAEGPGREAAIPCPPQPGPEATVEPWRPMSLRMAILALRLTKTIICHMGSGGLIKEEVRVDCHTLLIQIVGELAAARTLFRTTDHLEHLKAEGRLDAAKEKAKRVVLLLSPIRIDCELRLDDCRPGVKRRKQRPGGDPGSGSPPES